MMVALGWEVGERVGKRAGLDAWRRHDDRWLLLQGEAARRGRGRDGRMKTGGFDVSVVWCTECSGDEVCGDVLWRDRDVMVSNMTDGFNSSLNSQETQGRLLVVQLGKPWSERALAARRRSDSGRWTVELPTQRTSPSPSIR